MKHKPAVMKNTWMIVAIAGMAFAGCGDHLNESKLPPAVVSAVKTKYASTEKIEWEKATGGYEAEFYIGQVETKVLVDSAGNLLMQKQELKPAELPAAVTTAISTAYKDYVVDEADKLEKGGVTYYQVELDGKGAAEDLTLVYTADGKPADGISYWK
ncbi:MAG: hypothetical protein K0Q66_2217 [Chitinophagaceae bacterium]|jgi:hypothetical protein|nr:hypothetical protein [Chitinophagaceae bacterium]